MNRITTPLGDSLRWAAIILLIGGLACTVYACSNRYSTTNKGSAEVNDELLPQGARRVEAVGGKFVTVRAMDDPDNPYKDEYKPWDHWFYDHLLTEIPEQKPWGQLTEEEKAVRDAHSAAGMSWLRQRHHLDKDGFIVPDTRSIREFEEGIKDDTYEDRSIIFPWVMAEGDIDPEMHLAMWKAEFAVSAQYYPPVPAWLAENPPYEAMLLPNGDVVTRGLLGDSEKPAMSSCCGGKGSTIARYDCNGNLIRAMQDKGWFYLYYDADVNEKPAGFMSTSRDGYITFRDKDSDEILSVWNWDGSRVSAEKPAWRDPHSFKWLNSAILVEYYEASSTK